MKISWGRWRTRSAMAGLIGGAIYYLIILGADLWAAEIAAREPPCFSYCFPPAFEDRIGIHLASFVLGLAALVAVHEIADRRVVREPRGTDRALFAIAITLLWLPLLIAVMVDAAGLSARAAVVALVLAAPPAAVTLAYLLGPAPTPAPFPVRHPLLARVRRPPVGTRVVHAGRSLRHLFVPYPDPPDPPRPLR